MKKIVIWSGLLLLLFVSGLTKVQAQEQVRPIVIAQVNVENATIASQVGNIANISFIISNREGAQPGMRYSVQLSSTKNSGIIVDEKVYDEVVTLGAFSSVQKSIVYEAPKTLSGTYQVNVVVKNDKGFPYGFSSAGTIDLQASEQWVTIAPETCTLRFSDTPALGLSGVPQLLPGTPLSLLCTATNARASVTSVVPVIATTKDSSFGDSVELSPINNTPIVFTAKERKNLTVLIPVATTPGFYTTTVHLGAGEMRSNVVTFQYRILGSETVISHLSLDKDFYKRKDTAKVQVLWRESEPRAAVLRATLKSGFLSCGSTKIENPSRGLTQFEIPVRSLCVNPVLTVSIEDGQDGVLTQDRLEIVTTSQETTPGFFASRIGAFVLLGIIVVGAFVAILFLRKRKKMLQNGATALVIGTLSFLGATTVVDAAFVYYPYSIEYTVDNPSSGITVTLSASPNAMTLPVNETTLSWTTSGSPEACTASNAWTGAKSISGGTQLISGLTEGTYVFDITCTKTGVSNAFASALVVVNPAVATPSGTLTASNCEIATGASSCGNTVGWTTQNLTANPTAITRSSGTPASFTPSPLAGGTQGATLSYGTTNFFLYHNSALLASAQGTATCQSGSAWNGTICALTVSVTATLSASPSTISSGQTATLSWSSTNATSCSGSGAGFVTGGTTSGSDGVSPTSTTTYTVLCSGPSGSATAQAVVTVGAGAPECSDGDDNDGDGLTDEDDPGCHTDGDAGNALSYDANDTSELNRRRPIFKEF